MLTYVLYALLGFLLLAAGWKACDMQKEKQRKAAEEAELQQTLRDMGFNNENAEVGGSAYVGDSTSVPGSSSSVKSTTTTPAGSSATTTTAPTTTKTTTAPAEKPIAAKPAAPTTTTVPKNIVKPSASTQTSKGVAKTAVAGPGSGRWAVRAGTFSSIEGARKRLEQVIKAGYPKAEISKTTNGMSAVVVYRSNDKNAAIRIMDQLEEKGIDSAVFDRSKQ